MNQAIVAARAIPIPTDKLNLLLRIAVKEKKVGEVEIYQELIEEVEREIQMVPDVYKRVRLYLDLSSTVEEESGKENAIPLLNKAFEEVHLIPDLSGKIGSLLQVADIELELGDFQKAEEIFHLAIGTIEEEAIPDNKNFAIQLFRSYRDVWEKLGPEELARLEYILNTLPSDIENDKPYDLSVLVDIKARNGSIDQALDIAARMQKDSESKAHAIYKIAREKASIEPLNVCLKWAKALASPLDRVNGMYGIAMGLLD